MFDVAILALLAVVVVLLGDVIWIFSVSFVGLYQRALYGSRRHAFAFAGGLFLLWQVLAALPAHAEEIAPATSMALLLGLAFSAWLMQTIKRLVERQARMVTREVALAAAHDLLMCHDLDGIATIAVRAAAGLPMRGATGASLWRQEGDELALLAMSEEEIDLRRMPLSVMAPHVRAAYDTGQPSMVASEQVREGERELEQDEKYHTVLMAPVLRSGRPWGCSRWRALRPPDDGLLDVVARFASVVQNISDVILIVDRTGVVGFANDAVPGAFGFSPQAMEGSPILEMLHPDDRSRVAREVQGRDGPIESGAIRPSDTAARLGGDEFAVLLNRVRDASDALDIVGRVLVALEQPVTLTGREVPVRASVGVTVSTEDRASDALLRDADAAMYVAKSRGKHRVELFQPEMHATVLRRLELRAELQDALSRGEFEVHYQPIVDLGTREVISIEALLRWHHPERGPVTPDEFIPIAEQSGVIIELGRWVLEAACRTVARLVRAICQLAGVLAQG